MKKFIKSFLAFAMIITLCSCGQKQSGTMVMKNPETVTNPTVSITNGVETNLKGDFLFSSGNVDNVYDILGYYENEKDGEEFKAVGLYSWKKTTSLREEVEQTLKVECPDIYEDVELIENDFWKQKGDSHYFCYTVFDDKTFDEYTYYQAFFFEEEDLIKEFTIWYNTKPILIPSMDIECYIPVYAEDVELTEEDRNSNMFASFTFPDNFFVDTSFYEWDRNGYSIEDTIEWYKKNTQIFEVIDQYDYTSKESGKTYECVEIGFNFDYNGKPCSCLELNVLGEDKMFALFFHTPNELADEYLASTGLAMMYGIKKAK